MQQSIAPTGGHGVFRPLLADDGVRDGLVFLSVETDASPVRLWLAAFAPDGTVASGLAGLEDGSLDPVLAPAVIRQALAGCGLAPAGDRDGSHLDAILLTTPHPDVHVAVDLGAEPGGRFLLGFAHRTDDEPVEPAALEAPVRATMAALRRGLADAPAIRPAPALRPFRAREGGRSFAQLAARKGVPVDPAAATAVDKIQDAANFASGLVHDALKRGDIDAETAWERSQEGTRAWLIEAHRLVGGNTLTAVLGRNAVPQDPPPDAPGWPYWLRATIASGPASMGRKDGLRLLQAIQYLCGHEGHAHLDEAYRRIDVAAVSEIALVTLLRTPFMARDRLTEWEGFRERVRAEMFARGRDGDVVLVGLGKPEATPALGSP